MAVQKNVKSGVAGTRQKSSREKLLKRMIVVSGIALLLLILSFGTMEATSTPNFCSTCHQIKPAVQAWASGPHKTVNCLKCHADPGTLGYVKRKVGGLNEVYKQLTNSYDPNIQAKFNIDTCIQCHSGRYGTDYPQAKNITLASGSSPLAPAISHKNIIEQGISCLGCHRAVAHGEKKAMGQ